MNLPPSSPGTTQAARSSSFLGPSNQTTSPLPHEPFMSGAWQHEKYHTHSTIFIECSWASGRQDDLLCGHLTPEHLVAELIALAKEVALVGQVQHPLAQQKATALGGLLLRKKSSMKKGSSTDILRGTLDGLRVRVIHCKD